MTVRLYLLIAAAIVQSAPLPADHLIRLSRPLQSEEVTAVLAASRAAVDGKTFTLSYVGRVDGMNVLMRRDGWPQVVKGEGTISGGFRTSDGGWSEWSDYFVHIVEYTGLGARRCDGSPLSGELVVTYEHTGSTGKWTAMAGTSGQTSRGFHAGVPVANPVFDVLAGKVATVSAGATKMIDGRPARAFTAPFSPPPTTYGVKDGGGAVRQTLWIDVDWLLPVQWDVTQDSTVTDSLVLTYTSLDLRRPVGVEAPNCVP